MKKNYLTPDCEIQKITAMQMVSKLSIGGDVSNIGDDNSDAEDWGQLFG